MEIEFDPAKRKPLWTIAAWTWRGPERFLKARTSLSRMIVKTTGKIGFSLLGSWMPEWSFWRGRRVALRAGSSQ